MKTRIEKKKSRLRVVLMAAAALGSSSAMLSGTFAAFALQHSVATEATIA